MNEIYAFITGTMFGCIIARYFIGLGNKLSINAREGDIIGAKHKPTEQSSTD